MFSQFPRGVQETNENSWEDKEYMGYSMRTQQYRFNKWIKWDTKKVVARELYDHQADPGETINLIGDAKYKAITDSLDKEFDQKLKEAHRQGKARTSLIAKK